LKYNFSQRSGNHQLIITKPVCLKRKVINVGITMSQKQLTV